MIDERWTGALQVQPHFHNTEYFFPECSIVDDDADDWHYIFQIDCYDWDSDGSHDLIGSFTTNLADLLQAENKQVRVIPC